MNHDELVRRACATERGYFRLANEVVEVEGAVLVRSYDAPLIYDANHVNAFSMSTAAELEALLPRLDAEFAHCGHRCFKTDPVTPPEVLARLAMLDCDRDEFVLLLLEGELRAAPPSVEIVPVSSEGDWDAWLQLQHENWNEARTKDGRETPANVPDQMAATRRAKSPQVRYWLAIADGEPRAFCSSWPGVDGMGYVEDLFTQPAYRHRGLATALIDRCVRDARERGAGPCLIPADAHDTPKHMYAALGFRPVAIGYSWNRFLEPSPRR